MPHADRPLTPAASSISPTTGRDRGPASLCSADVDNDKRLLYLHCSTSSVTLLNEALAVVRDTASGCEGTIRFAATTLNKEYQLSREYQLPENAKRESSVCPPSSPVMVVLRACALRI